MTTRGSFENEKTTHPPYQGENDNEGY